MEKFNSCSGLYKIRATIALLKSYEQRFKAKLRVDKCLKSIPTRSKIKAKHIYVCEYQPMKHILSHSSDDV